LATEQLGSETAVKLKQQTDQLVNIHRNVDLIESDLQRADKIVRPLISALEPSCPLHRSFPCFSPLPRGQMRAFMRRLATDKLILCFILLIIVGIIVIVM
jgi:SNARE protein